MALRNSFAKLTSHNAAVPPGPRTAHFSGTWLCNLSASFRALVHEGRWIDGATLTIGMALAFSAQWWLV